MGCALFVEASSNLFRLVEGEEPLSTRDMLLRHMAWAALRHRPDVVVGAGQLDSRRHTLPLLP